MALTMKKWMTGVGLLWGLLLPSAAMAEPPEIPPDIQTYLDDFRTAVSEVEDARLVFSRREWLNGSYRPYQELSMAFRKSGDIYIRFSGDTKDEKSSGSPQWMPYMLVKPSPILPVLKLDPHGSLAKKDSQTSHWSRHLSRIGGPNIK